MSSIWSATFDSSLPPEVVLNLCGCKKLWIKECEEITHAVILYSVLVDKEYIAICLESDTMVPVDESCLPYLDKHCESMGFIVVEHRVMTELDHIDQSIRLFADVVGLDAQVECILIGFYPESFLANINTPDVFHDVLVIACNPSDVKDAILTLCQKRLGDSSGISMSLFTYHFVKTNVCPPDHYYPRIFMNNIMPCVSAYRYTSNYILERRDVALLCKIMTSSLRDFLGKQDALVESDSSMIVE